VGLCSPPPVFSPGGTIGGTWVPPAELLAQSRARIAQRNATVDDYLLDAFANAVERNFTAAQTRYSQALELAVKNNDFERQAIAHSSMGEIYAATGNLKEAASQLTLATGIYQRLGSEQRVSELNQRLVEINRQLQIDPSRIQIDPSRIQIDPSRIQIQK
jgi:tetratricopeptide (TPR) repeat protein